MKKTPILSARSNLHDILVCKTIDMLSIGNRRQVIPFVSEVLWQVESELALTHVRYPLTLARLVMGSAEKKLFVTMRSKSKPVTEKLIEVCEEMGSCISGELYLCLLDHIDEWSVNCESPKVTELVNF